MLHILLIEDNPADAQVLEMALRRAGVPVDLHLLSDGEEAVEYLTGSGRPSCDLVLLDLNLPKLSGFEVLSQIKSHEHLKDLPVVVMSGSANAEDVERCYRGGASSYICKRSRLQEILDSTAKFAAYWANCVELPSRGNGVLRH